MLTETNKEDRRKARWLVLAAQYPSVNQPWLETYLTNLIEHRVQPVIVSCNRHSGDGSDDQQVARCERLVVLAQYSRARTMLAAVKMLAGNWSLSIRVARAFAQTARLRSLREVIGSVSRALEALRIIKATSPDGIHAHSLALAAAFVYPARILDLPLVVTYHGQEPRGVPQIPRYVIELVFEQASVVLANTNFAAAQAHSLGCPATKTKVIPQGIPLDRFSPGRQWSNRSQERVQLLSVGRLVPEKGNRYAVLVLAELRRRGVPAHLTIVGDGPERSSLVALIAEHKLEECVTLMGAQETSTVQRLLQQADFLLLFSSGASSPAEWTETQGVVVQEAQASGCIPIAFAVGGVPEGIQDRVDGFLVEEFNWMKAVEIVSWLNAAPADAATIADHAVRAVAKKYDAKRIGDRMSEILQEAVNRHGISGDSY